MRYFAIRANMMMDDHTIEVKRPRLEVGDASVLIKGTGEAMEFVGVCVVESIAPRPSEDEPDVVTLSGIIELTPHRPLVCFAGSLRRVWHYLHPWLNFRRAVVSLEKDDFWSILYYEVDPQRTLFRCLSSSMPDSLLDDFFRRHLRDIPTTGRGNRINNYRVAAELFQQFFQDSVTRPFSLVPRFIQEFDSLAEMRIEGVPDLGQLTIGTADRPIRLGSMSERTALVLSENQLFASRNGSLSLLEASGAMLSEAEPTRPHRRSLNGPFPETMNFVTRVWRDPIL
jgi:hypothetical protein